MIIRQRAREHLAPISAISVDTIITEQGVTTSETHRDVEYLESSAAAYHNEYVVSGMNGEVSIASQSVEGALDISEWPRIKRIPGIDASVDASFMNNRATTSIYTLDFNSYGGQPFKFPAFACAAGSLLGVTKDIVDALASALTSNSMWNASGNRDQTSAIPHSLLTGHVWNGRWGSTSGAGLVPATGRRFVAITPRHLYGCGLYQYEVGQKIYWKDISNNIVERTVVEVVNFASETAQAGIGSFDMSITLIDSDLPAGIHIPPVIGPWAQGIFSNTAESIGWCGQIAGITLWNNDGHISPFLLADQYDQTGLQNPQIFEGIELKSSRLKGVFGVNNRTSIVSWPSDNPGDKFYHSIRGGDSGSPCFVPCAEGWAYSGHISPGTHPMPDLFNEMIDLIDTRAGISTGHAVTVATDPTL